HTRLSRAIAAACGVYENLPHSDLICLFRGEAKLMLDVLPCPSALPATDLFGRRRVALVRIREKIGEQWSTEVFREWKYSTGARGKRDRVPELEALKKDIYENCANPRLSLGWLARRHGTTARAIRNMFYSRNTNFTAWLMQVRLDHARDMLGDPDHADTN